MEISGEKILLSKISARDLDFICRIECDENVWSFEDDVETDENIVRHIILKSLKKARIQTTMILS